MRIRYDFSAPATAHFGIVKTIDEALADIPNPVDFWTPTESSVLNVAGRVAEWTGMLGRKFTQPTPQRRPLLEGSEILFGDGAGVAKSSLELTGDAIGLVTNLTIAGKFRVPANTLTLNQTLFGQGAPVFRATYRYANNNNFIRFDVNSPSIANMDRDLPDGVTEFDTILVIANGTAARVMSGGAETSGALPGPQTLSQFAIGAPAAVNISHAGWIGKVGIWRHAVDSDQLALLQRWLAT